MNIFSFKGKIVISGLSESKKIIRLTDSNNQEHDFRLKRKFIFGFKLMYDEISFEYFGMNLTIARKLIILFNNLINLRRIGYNNLLKLLFIGDTLDNIQIESGVYFKSIKSLESDKPFWISRYAINQGFRSPVLSHDIEWQLLRNYSKFYGFLWRLPIQNYVNNVSFNSKKLETNLTLNQLNGDIPASNLQNLETFYNSTLIPFVGLVNRGNFIPTIVNDYAELISWPTNKVFKSNNNLSYLSFSNNTDVEREKGAFFGYSSSWFHFIIEILPFYLKYSNELIGYPLIIGNDASGQLLELIELVTKLDPIILHQGEPTRFATLKSISREARKYDTNFFNEFDLKLVKTSIQNSLGNSFDSNVKKNLYVMRRHTLFRNLINDNEIKEFLQNKNFTCIYPEDYSFSEQYSLFTNAKNIVIESGAAMTNLIFCRPNTKIIEINPGDGGVGFWSSLTRICNLEMISLIGTPRKGSRLGEFKLDLELLKNVSKKLGI